MNQARGRLRIVLFAVVALGCLFGRCSVAAAPAGERALLLAPDLQQPPSGGQADAELPKGSHFEAPPENACKSRYDDFYGSEPGVYAYWALCETGTNPAIHDYVGQYDFDTAHISWRKGTITGDPDGPVKDGEGAISIAASAPSTQVAQNFVLNKNAGTIAAWVKIVSLPGPGTGAIPFSVWSLHGYSGVSIVVSAKNDAACFGASWQNSTAHSERSSTDGNIWLPEAKCGFPLNAWHRVVLTWGDGRLRMYVDGTLAHAAPYTGAFSDQVFLYRLFPAPGGAGMMLAKALVSNQSWSDNEAAADYAPTFPKLNPGGVRITNRALGTIHRDVLGYAEDNSDLSNPKLVASLVEGLRAAGVTSLRYASGGGGISADLSSWDGKDGCTPKRGITAHAQSEKTTNTLDTYLANVARPLGLHVGYTVNYGTNPPLCDAGGDPETNGGKLVDYANNARHYGIKYWEVGNEVWSKQSEPDFHDRPNKGESYAENEAAFYKTMKGRDPSISIAVPIALGIYDWLNFSLSTLTGASYDAAVMHNYPVHDPVSDGATLYQDRVASNSGRTRGNLLSLQTMLLNAGKKPDSIWVTEWNGDAGGGGKWSRQSMGAVMPLFATMQLAEFMRAGVQYATWWTQGRNPVCMTYYYDWTGESAYNWYSCGSLALTYTGPVPVEKAVGLRPGDLTPVGRAFQILSESGFVAEGEHMLETVKDSQGAPWLLSYAATHAHSYAVILINRDRDEAHTVPVSIDGKTSGAAVTQWTYGRAQYDQTHSGNWSVGPASSRKGPWEGTFNAVLPPWSVNVLIF
jgi:hypothetical protein